MAETAQDTPAPTTMKQAFDQAAADLEKALPSGEEQVEAPVSNSSKTQDAEAKPNEAAPPKPATQAKDGKGTVDEDKAGAMRAADYTRKTQELARQRDELKQHTDFAEAWMPTAKAYHRAPPEVQAQIKSLLETGKMPSSARAQGSSAAPESDRINKLLDSFEERDRGTVKDILQTFMEEAEDRISKKYGELDNKINEKSRTIEQEATIRQQRDADIAWQQFDRECPEWRELSEYQVKVFQRDILEDPNVDPIRHFKDVFLPELGSRGKKEANETVTNIIKRAGQAVPRGSGGAAAQPAEKFDTMRDALEATARKMGF